MTRDTFKAKGTPAVQQPPSASVRVEDVVMAARNAENTIRNCAAAGQIGEGYVQYADDLRDAVQRLAQQPEARGVVDVGLSLADLCRLSGVFDDHSEPHLPRDRHIKEWLGKRIAEALAQQPAVVGTKPLSEFMAEQEALHPGIRDKMQAAADELRAEIERLRGNVRPRREDECLTLNHWRMRAYDLERNWSRCSHACAVEQAKREQAEARAEQLAEALALLPDDSGMVEHSPEEGPFMFCCGREVTYDWLHGPICTHDEDCWYARMRALRDDMSKGYNHHEEVE